MVALLRAGEHRSRCRLYNHALHAHRSDTVATAETVGYAYYDNNYSAYFDDSYEPGVQQTPLTPPSLLPSPTHYTYENERQKTAAPPSILAKSSLTATSVTTITAATSFQPCLYSLLFALSRSILMFLEGSAPNHGTFDAKGKSDRSVFKRGHAQGGIGSQSENGDNVCCRGSGW